MKIKKMKAETKRMMQAVIIAEFRHDIESGKVSVPDDTPDLIHLCELLESGQYSEAEKFARNMDTYPLEGIRKRVWMVILQPDIEKFD